MDRLIVLTDFDIFAYLMCGLAALVASDLILGTRIFFRKEWGFGSGTAIVILAYVLGQTISIPSDWVLEDVVVKGLLGNPTNRLILSEAELLKRCPTAITELKSSWFERSIAFYGVPLPCNVQYKIRSRADGQQGGNLFAAAFLVAKHDKNAYDRMQIFQRLFFFCRNMALVFLTAAIGAVVLACFKKTRRGQVQKDRAPKLNVPDWLLVPRWQAVIFFVIGLGLFYRFVFFYRTYFIEVYNAFASPAP